MRGKCNIPCKAQVRCTDGHKTLIIRYGFSRRDEPWKGLVCTCGWRVDPAEETAGAKAGRPTVLAEEVM